VYGYAGMYNGLVLLALRWSNHNCTTAVLVNPASDEEVVIATIVCESEARQGLGDECETDKAGEREWIKRESHVSKDPRFVEGEEKLTWHGGTHELGRRIWKLLEQIVF
jgi:hypothetical protein